MRSWSVPPLLLALLWVLASVAAPLRAADDPGTVFVQVYQSYQDGEKLESDGKLDDALQKFNYCVNALEQLQQKSPQYEPVVVDFRLRKSREAIARVQSQQSPAPTVATADAPLPPPAPRTSSSSLFDRDSLQYRVPVDSRGTPVPQNSAAPRYEIPAAGAPETADQIMERGALKALKDEVDILRAQVDQGNRTIEDLNNQLLESTAQVQSAQKENDLRNVHEVEQQSQLAQMRQSHDDLQQANDRLSRENESDQHQITELQTSLKAARADVEVADEYNSELFAKLGQAAKFIDADEKIRTQLLSDRRELSERVLAGPPDTKKIEKERDAAVAKSDELQKQVDDSAKVEDQNRILAKKLAFAEAQIVQLSKDKDQRQKIEGGLQDQVAAVNKTLEAMRDQLKSGQKRVAELEKQLSDTADASTSATGEMAAENTLLKSLVTRQLKEQAKRQQARKLVEEEMEKLQIRSTSLMDKLDSMAGEETPLTSKEKKLVDRPAVTPDGHSDFTLEVVKKTPQSDLPPELVARASEANALAQEKKFSEARDIYAEIAKKAPQSYLAAVNLGIGERQLGDFAPSIAAFKRALELKPGDAFALTNLGTVEYRSGDLTEAAKTLHQAVAVDSESYLAHYLLATVLNDQGDSAGARREVQRSLYLKADYAPSLQLSDELAGASAKPAPAKAAAQAQD